MRLRCFFSLMFLIFLLLNSFNFSTAAHIADSQGLKLDIPSDIFPLVKIETSNDSNNIFRISELGSIESAKKIGADAYGAGWIFTISKVSKDSLHKMLQNDMSGVELFAYKDNYFYLYNHPTDVRFVRENNAITERDQNIWSKVNEWGFGKVRDNFSADNNLFKITADNSGVGITLARVMYGKNLSYIENFPLVGVDAEKYLKGLLYDSNYIMTDEPILNDKCIEIKIPRDKVTLKFYTADGMKNYVTQVYDGGEPINFKGESLNARNISTEVAKLYQAVLDKSNKTPAVSGNSFIGGWHESIAGRGHIEIKKIGERYNIDIRWGESAAATSFWKMSAIFKNGALIYDDCEYKSIEFDGKGGEKIKRHYENGRGSFKLLATGELVWNDLVENVANDSIFLRD